MWPGFCILMFWVGFAVELGRASRAVRALKALAKEAGGGARLKEKEHGPSFGAMAGLGTSSLTAAAVTGRGPSVYIVPFELRHWLRYPFATVVADTGIGEETDRHPSCSRFLLRILPSAVEISFLPPVQEPQALVSEASFLTCMFGGARLTTSSSSIGAVLLFAFRFSLLLSRSSSLIHSFGLDIQSGFHSLRAHSATILSCSSSHINSREGTLDFFTQPILMRPLGDPSTSARLQLDSSSTPAAVSNPFASTLLLMFWHDHVGLLGLYKPDHRPNLLARPTSYFCPSLHPVAGDPSYVAGKTSYIAAISTCCQTTSC